MRKTLFTYHIVNIKHSDDIGAGAKYSEIYIPHS